jgi:hypothetical protein
MATIPTEEALFSFVDPLQRPEEDLVSTPSAQKENALPFNVSVHIPDLMACLAQLRSCRFLKRQSKRQSLRRARAPGTPSANRSNSHRLIEEQRQQIADHVRCGNFDLDRRLK